jgi:hypothetical protein
MHGAFRDASSWRPVFDRLVGNTLAKIVKSDSRVWVDSTGIRILEVAG